MENKKGLKRDKDINELRETEKKWQTERETKRGRTKMNDDASGVQQKRIIRTWRNRNRNLRQKREIEWVCAFLW